MKLAVGLAIEAGPKISDKDLGTLEEPDGLGAAFIDVLVTETWKVSG